MIQDLIRTLADGRYEVPDSVVERYLKHEVKSNDSIDSLQFSARDGEFDVEVEVHKLGAPMTVTKTFTFGELVLNQDDQRLVIKPLNKTKYDGEGIYSRIVTSLIKILLRDLFDADPADKNLLNRPEVTRNNKNFEVDLAETVLGKVLQSDRFPGQLNGFIESIESEEDNLVLKAKNLNLTFDNLVSKLY